MDRSAMKIVLVLVGVAIACQAFLLDKKHECTSASDCPSTHCCVTDYQGEYCFHYQNKSQPCHLAGHTAHLYKCGCLAGHVCEALHLDPQHLVNDPNNTLSQVEQILGHAGYGICVPSHT